MHIRTADTDDINIILLYDKHISERELTVSVNLKRVFIAEDSDGFCGWMRYNLFWDNTPFMNMLYFTEQKRGRGYGKQMVRHWENEMKSQGYSTVMTSTPSDECSQHFYTKLGYKTSGGFTPENEPFELIMTKKI